MADEKIKITGTAKGSHASDHDYRLDLSVELSLRDLFAAFALAGMLANSGYHFDSGDDADERAAQAYSFAESMLEERSRPLAAREGTGE